MITFSFESMFNLLTILLAIVGVLVGTVIIIYILFVVIVSGIIWPYFYLSSGCSTILASARLENMRLLKFFHTTGADVNFKDHHGWTAIHWACSYNSINLIEFLLRKGADVSVENKNGQTPFSLLRSGRYGYGRCKNAMIKEFSRLSFENVPISIKDANLIQVSSKNHRRFRRYLTELKVLENTKFYKNYTYYSMLKMSNNMRKLAHLTENNLFVTAFLEGLIYPCYKKNLLSVLEEAVALRRKFETAYLNVNSAFGNALPEVVLREIADNVTFEDLSEQQVNKLQIFTGYLHIVFTPSSWNLMV